MTMTIGERIKARRKSKNLTQKQLSDKAGISLMSIQRYERDERQPTVEILEKICTALDIAVIDLIGLDGMIGTPSTRPQHERDLLNAAQKNISHDKFWYGKTELNNKIKKEMLHSIENIAKISNISIEEAFTPEVHEIISPATETEPPETVLISGGEFDGIIIKYNDTKFKISANEYYQLADRIIENIAINLLALQTYKK